MRVFALLPDSVSDETEKLLPPIRGEGTARFARNGRDIVLSLSLLSLGQIEKLFSPGGQAEDGTARQYLEWKDAHYTSRYEYAASPFTALYAVARCLRYPDLTATHKQYLGSRGEQLVRENKSQDAGGFRVRRMIASGDRATYLMSGNVGSFLVEVGKSNGIWSVASFKNAPAQAGIASAATKPTPPPPAPAPAPSTKSETPAPIVVHQAPVNPPAATTGEPTSSTKPLTERQDREKAKLEQQKQEQERIAREQKEKERLAKQEKERLAKENQKKQEAETARTEAAAHPAGEQAKISQHLSAGAVNLRSGPSTGAKPVTSVGKGAAIEILGKQNGWYKVRYQGSEGYVYAGLVDYKKADAYTTATLTKTKPVTDANKKPLGKPQVGDRLVVLGGLENNKYKVQLANGKTGYVDKDALDVAIEEPQLVP